MTEQEWQAYGEPQPMLKVVRGEVSDRKLRLFACACCRLVWDLLPGPNSSKAVEIAEEFAEGRINWERLEVAGREAVLESDPAEESNAGYWATEAEIDVMLVNACWCPVTLTGWSAMKGRGDQVKADAARQRVRSAQCDLIREIFGNPFRPVAIDPAWQTPKVLALATAAYEDRILPAGTLDPARLTILADALEEAGCDNADMLSHCRQPGEHVRGCWVVDLLLGLK
jgi:hypothetical protein